MQKEPLEIDRICEKCQGSMECITPIYFKTKKFKCGKCSRVTRHNSVTVCFHCTKGIQKLEATSTVETSKTKLIEYHYRCDLCGMYKVYDDLLR